MQIHCHDHLSSLTHSKVGLQKSASSGVFVPINLLIRGPTDSLLWSSLLLIFIGISHDVLDVSQADEFGMLPPTAPRQEDRKKV